MPDIGNLTGLTSRRRRRALLLIAILLLCAGLFWLLTADDNVPDFSTHPWLDAPEPIAISHQGAPLPGEPLDLAGFRRAVEELGYQYIETDVRLVPVSAGSTDFALVAIHDVDGKIGSIAEIEDGTGLTVARVSDLLDPGQFPGVRWNLELKGGDVETADALATILAATPGSTERVCISYGDIRSIDLVADIRRVLPADTCSCASFPEKSALFDNGLVRALTARFRETDRGTSAGSVSCVQILHNLITVKDVEEAHAAGIEIHAWESPIPETLFGDTPVEIDVPQWATSPNMSEDRMNELLDMGVDGIISDDAELLQRVFACRLDPLWVANQATLSTQTDPC